MQQMKIWAHNTCIALLILLKYMYQIRVITKLPNSEQSSKGKVKVYKQNQLTTGKL